MTPTLCGWLIARNEARDIGRAMASIAPICTHLVLVDTGSTDDTVAEAMRAAGDRSLIVDVYTGASEQDAEGNWRITDFAKARNHALALAEATGCDYAFWLDADEQVLNPQALRRATYYSRPDVFAAWVHQGGQRWIRQCLWKTGRGIRFHGAVHEWPKLDGCAMFTLDDCAIVHDATPAESQEDSNARNLRILLATYDAHPNARDAFYLANTHKDAGRFAEAVPWYQLRIGFGPEHRDEWLFAHLYCARAQRLAGDTPGAEATLEAAISAEYGWCEFHMEHAFAAYHTKRYHEAIERATRALLLGDRPIPITHLFREIAMYTDQPARLLSWCHEHLGNYREALRFAELAAQQISGPDPDWAARIMRLRGLCEPPAVVRAKLDAIALCRPGAIGDILMTLNLLPALKAAHPGREVHYFCDRSLGQLDALGSTLMAAGVDVIMDSARWDSWRERYALAVPLIGYPLHDGYPERAMRWHLLQYFATELGLVVGGLPSLRIRKPKRPVITGQAPDEPYATVQYRAGWSKYKEWPIERWQQLFMALDIPLVTLGDDQGRTLAESIAVFANASLHIGIDSWPNHATHYTWLDGEREARVPGVILWGSTQVTGSGYARNTNISLGLQCQPCFRETHPNSRHPRGPCDNVAPSGVHACMDGIGVERVAQAVREAWTKATAPAVMPVR